jgi:hypothetical protein
MRLKQFVEIFFEVFLLCEASIASAQTSPTASTSNSPFVVGVGLSAYNPAWISGHILGGTLWIDYSPNQLPWYLRGLGIEAEARDLNYDRSARVWPGLRQDTAMGGPMYACPYFSNLHPYAKFLVGYGNTDYESLTHVRHHDSRTITAKGGGVDWRAYRGMWLRVDYEYQIWPDFFHNPGNKVPAGTLNSQGFTIGATFHFDEYRSLR